MLETTSERSRTVRSSEPVGNAAPSDRVAASFHRRGWLVRRAVVVADLEGLVVSFTIAEELAGQQGLPVRFSFELALFALTFPLWVVLAKIYGLYERDEERTEHTTVDDFVGVFHLVTVCVWVLFAGAWFFNVANPPLDKITTFWILAIVLIPTARSVARGICHRRPTYIQNTVIVGAGEVGQLVARKFLQHPEYGIRLMGFVDSHPRERRKDVRDIPVIGSLDELHNVIERNGIERVVVAFAGDPTEDVLESVRSLRDCDVQIDIVPRLF